MKVETLPAVKWLPTTEDRYDEMLGVLPPASWGTNAFQVGEAMDHKNGRPTFASFKHDDAGNFFESEEALTFKEFKAEVPDAEYYGS